MPYSRGVERRERGAVAYMRMIRAVFSWGASHSARFVAVALGVGPAAPEVGRGVTHLRELLRELLRKLWALRCQNGLAHGYEWPAKVLWKKLFGALAGQMPVWVALAGGGGGAVSRGILCSGTAGRR